MSSTYLITGGAGFIGSHLAESLLADGKTVQVIDDLSTGSLQNLQSVLDHPRFTLTVDTIMNRQLMADLIDRADYVCHLAAVVGTRRVLESPINTIHNIVVGTSNVLELASEKGKVVYVASTSEVYGKSRDLPFTEDGDLVLGPTNKGRWSYACSKAIDEYLALAYHWERQLPVVVGRHFNTVGPRQSARYGMVLPRFIEQALAEQPITVYGDGSQRRCFCYVDDVVWAIKRLVTRADNYGKVFNIGACDEITILDLARLVKDKARSSSKIVFVPYDVAYDDNFEDMVRRIPDLRRLQEATGYRPRTGLAEIIDRIMELQMASAA
ncbi:MAG: nucleoside-diphosphate sugar epimerase [Burkholderiales bacterium RIFCSPLOWO2_02_FULL_57_36]|nr:MAG: nucleoside-diphosphate sugar epimerase [Burkholderiales bacterium RIFCSPLOWO2_02_FULL_57_36]